MVPHRATYDVAIVPGSQQQPVTGSGTMVLEVRKTCDGLSLRNETRLSLDMGRNRPVSNRVVQDYWEARDGLRFRFSTVNRLAGRVVQQYAGTAKLDGPGKAGSAQFAAPSQKKVTLQAGTLFPFAFARRYADLWRTSGERRSYLYFDGASPDMRAMRVIARALKSTKLAAGSPTGDQSLLTSTPKAYEFVYFSSSGADSGPYLTGVFLLQRNGVTRAFSTVTSGMTLNFTLRQINALKPPNC